MDPETEISSSKRGNWITFPFIIGTMGCLTLASGGFASNLIIFLIKQFNIKTINAAQISNRVNSGLSFSPIIGAILADSFIGSFSVVAISCCLSFLGLLVITLTSVIDSLRPKPCQMDSIVCQSPSDFQYAVLYFALVVCCIGFGITRFTLSTFGANQFDKQKDQGRFFNWYFFVMYFCFVLSSIAIVNIQDHVSWGAGYGICLGASFIGLLVFVLGNKFYRRDMPQGCPFTSLARVVVASFRKMKISSKVQHLYYQSDATSDQPEFPPKLTNSLRFFDKAAIKTEGDINPDGSLAKPWKLCTIQEVEDFKSIIKILPVWSTSIILSVPIANQGSFTVLQALVMDRHLGHLNVPAGTILVLSFISSFVSLTFIDRFFPLLWQKVTQKTPTPFQRIGIGHVLIALSLVVSALVEKRRLQADNNKAEMFAVWLYPQLILVGIGEAFYFPGQVSFYYQEFPVSLRSTATAMSSLAIGIAFYLSTDLVDIIQACSDWLPNNINNGRLDNVYWVLFFLGVINLCYFVCCAKYYKHQRNAEMPKLEISLDSAHRI